MSHSPTPWKLRIQSRPGEPSSARAPSAPFRSVPIFGCAPGAQGRIDAAHIVTCVNTHDGLLTALEKAAENIEASLHGERPPHNDLKLAAEMRVAITKARGGK